MKITTKMAGIGLLSIVSLSVMTSINKDSAFLTGHIDSLHDIADTQEERLLAEELAATAEEMSGQAEQLQQAVAFFKMDSDSQLGQATVVNAPPVPAAHLAPVQLSPKPKVVVNDKDFEKF